MGRIVVFSNQKGGVGKTTACVNVAACLCRRGKKVLLIDLDPKGNATTGLGVIKSGLQGSVYNTLIGGENADYYIIKTCVNGLFLLPSNIDLYGAEIELAYRKNREMCLKTAINGIKDFYDYILIDCPPSLGLLTVNAFAAADGVIIPTFCEYYAAEGLSQLLSTVKLIKRGINPTLNIDGILVTMFEGRSLVARQILEQLTVHFGESVFKTVIPKNVRIAESSSYGVPVILHDDKSQGAIFYENFTDEYIKECPKTRII